MIVNKDRSGKSGIKQLSESAKECVEKHHTLFFEEGVLNIPIYREYSESIISVIYFEKGELSLEFNQGFFRNCPQKITNAEIEKYESEPTAVIELHLPDFCKIAPNTYLIEKVVDGFSVKIGADISGMKEEELLALFGKDGYYATRPDALKALPRDIIIRKGNGTAHWDSRKYNEEGYEVVSMASANSNRDGKAEIMIHLRRR